MKRIFSILFAPLAALAIAAGCIEAWRRYPDLIDNEILQFGLIGSAAFAVSFVLINHLFQWRTRDKISRLHAGTRRYELDIAERLDKLSRTTVLRSDFENLTERLSLLDTDLTKPSYAENLNIDDRRLPGKSVISTQVPQPANHRSQSSGQNVIPLNPSSRKTAQSDNENTKVRVQGNLATLIANGRLKMYLQPYVELPEGNIPGYEALARLELDDGTIAPSAAFIQKAEATNCTRLIDQEILEQTLTLLRTLRRKKQTSRIFWNISPATLKTKSRFTDIKEILAANKSLKSSLVVEVPADKFLSLGKKQLGRLTTIRGFGFQLSLQQCTTLEIAQEAIRSGLFSFVKVPVSTLGEFGASEAETIAGQIAAALRGNDISIIATEVEEENQVMRLIDHDINLAQGYLFSAPRQPKADGVMAELPPTGQAGF